MFPEYTELRSLDSTKREIIINTDNWPEMRKLITSKSQNPQDKHFDWAFWCGILNNKDYNTFVEEYKKTAAYAEFFKGSKQAVDAIINQRVKSLSPARQIILRRVLKETLNQINTDHTRWGTTDTNLINIIRRVLFTIYINRSKQGYYYVQGEGFLLRKLYDIAVIAKPKDPEPMLYKLADTLLFKCKLKILFYPCTQITVDHQVIYYYPVKKLAPHQFIEFLFMAMLMKYRRNIFKGLSEKSTKYRNDFFSILCQNGILNQHTAFKNTDTFDYKKVIGETLVCKNAMIYFSYILSCWEGRFPPALSYTITGEPSNTDIWQGPTENGEVDGRDFFQLLKTNGNVYKSLYPLKQKDVLDFLMKKGKMMSLTKLAKKHFKHGSDPSRGESRPRTPPTYRLPTNFVISGKGDKKKSNKTAKKSGKKSKRKTLKRSQSHPS